MLILERAPGQQVRVKVQGTPQELLIRVEDTSYGRVKLVFDAPRNFVILRDELLDSGQIPGKIQTTS